MAVEYGDIELAVEQFAGNQEFIRLYNRHNRELLLQHFLLIAAAGDEVWRMNQEKKMPMTEQRDQMLVKYMEWLARLNTEFPEVPKPPDVNEDWWRLMLLAYERKPISGKSLWRKFKEDTRNPILSSFNVHWGETREGEPLEARFKSVRRGVWRDLGHREDEFLAEGTWLPKQWYAWRYCCYPGKNFRAFDGKLPSVSLGARQRSGNNLAARAVEGNMSWATSLPIDPLTNHDAALHSSLIMNNHARLVVPAVSTPSSGSLVAGAAVRVNRATLPTSATNQRLLSAASTMTRPHCSPEEELSVHQYLADVQRYAAQMARLEKAAALAESFGDLDKALGFKRQLYEHVQSEPPSKLAHIAAHDSTTSQGQSHTSSSLVPSIANHFDVQPSSSHESHESLLQHARVAAVMDGMHHGPGHGAGQGEYRGSSASMPVLEQERARGGGGGSSRDSASSSDSERD